MTLAFSRRRTKFRNFAVFMLGFLLPVNLYLIPGREFSPRIFDVIGVILIIFFLYRLNFSKISSRVVLGLIGVLVFPLIGMLMAFDSGDNVKVLLSFRWIAAFFWGFTLWDYSKKKETRNLLFKGLVIGIVVNLIVLVLQWQGFGDYLLGFGLAAPNEYIPTVYGVARYPGIHGQPGSTMPIISLLIPIVIYDVYANNKSIWNVVTAWLVVGASFGLTWTRSPVLVAAITNLVALFFTRPDKYLKSILLGISIVLFIGLSLTTSSELVWRRWSDVNNISSNSQERIVTILDAVSLAARRPMGTTREEKSIYVGATHNAFLQVAVLYGLFFGVIVTLSIIFATLRLIRRDHSVELVSKLEGLIGLQTLGLFMFEEHLSNPIFMAITAWLFVSFLSPPKLYSGSKAAVPG